MKPWFVVNFGNSSEPVDVSIYGQIGRGWDGESGVDASAFSKEWDKIPKAQAINLRIHSPGGSVFDALAIYNIISQRRNTVTAHIDGVALSAASFIAMAAGKVVMPKTARMMIHDAQGFAIGDSAEMRGMAELLDRESNRIADIYATKTGKSRTDMRALMQQTTWMDGDEALDLGFVDEVTNLDAKNCNFDLSVFRIVPEDMRNKTKSAVQNNGGATTGDTVNKTAIIALLLSHGVKVDNSATDETIIAELNKLVTAGRVTNAERTQLTAQASTPAPATAPLPANVVSIEAFQMLQNQLNTERTARITASFDRIVADNPSIDRATWLPLVLRDESMLANLGSLPGRIVDPSRPSVSNQGSPLVEKYLALQPGAERLNFRLSNEVQLLRHASAINPEAVGRGGNIYGPQNVNTLAAALTPDYLADGLVINARNRLAPLAAFSRDFGIDPMKPKSTVQVARATSGATGQTDPSNWESGDTTLAAIGVSVSQKSVSFHLTNDQLNKGHQMANLAGINADQFADLISDVWTALLVVGTYGTPGAGTGIIGAATAFAPDDLPQIFSLAKNFRRRNLILDGSFIGYLMPGVASNFNSGLGTTGFAGGQSTFFGSVFGFDGIWMQNRYTSAVANCVGFACGPDAIAVASGLPISTSTPSNEFISQQVVNIDGAGSNMPSIGLSVQVNTWYSRATRTIWASYDVMFGAAAGDASTTLTLGHGRLLVSA